MDELIFSYQKDVITKEKTFLGYTAKAIEAKRDGSKSNKNEEIESKGFDG